MQTSLYIVLTGIYNVSTQAKGKPVHLDTVCEGDCLGEVAIFHPNNASATVTGLMSGKLWVINATALQEFLLAWPSDGCAAGAGHQHHLEPAPETGQLAHPHQRDRA